MQKRYSEIEHAIPLLQQYHASTASIPAADLTLLVTLFIPITYETTYIQLHNCPCVTHNITGHTCNQKNSFLTAYYEIFDIHNIFSI